MYTNHNNSDDNHLDVVSVVPKDTADYHYRIKNNIPLPDNPYSLMITSQPGPCHIVEKTYNRHGGLRDEFIVNSVIKSDWNIFTKNQVKMDKDVGALADNRINKLLAKIKGQSLPILMLYLERKKTASMVSEFVKKARYTIRYIRHPRLVLRKWGITDVRPSHIKRVRYALKRANTYGDAFLAYRFAWLPFVSDIQDLFKAQARYEKKGRDFRQTAKLPFEFTYDNKYLDGGYSGLPSIATCSGVYAIQCRYRITDASLASLSQLMDIETTAWDAVPWSFMIDRIVDISKWLDLRNATAGTSFVSGTISTKRKMTFQFKAAQYKCDPRTYEAMPAGASWDRYKVCEVSGPPRVDFVYTRELLTSFPEPRLEYPLEGFFDGIKLADDVALLGKQLGRFFKGR